MSTPQFEERIAAVRRFSRFYTRQLGLLQESLVHTRFSLTEARVLYELAHREHVTASELAADLDLDHGYLSRILRRFGDEGLLKKVRAANDGRQSVISITAKGRKAFAPLNKNSHDQVAAMLEKMSEAEQIARHRRDGIDRVPALAEQCAAGADHSAPTPRRRHGLGHVGAWRDLRAGIWLGHHVRGAGGEDYRGVHRELRRQA